MENVASSTQCGIFNTIIFLYNNSCTNKMYIGCMNSQRLIRACTLASYTLDLDLVLEAIGVQLDVHLVLICKPGVPS